MGKRCPKPEPPPHRCSAKTETGTEGHVQHGTPRGGAALSVDFANMYLTMSHDLCEAVLLALQLQQALMCFLLSSMKAPYLYFVSWGYVKHT